MYRLDFELRDLLAPGVHFSKVFDTWTDFGQTEANGHQFFAFFYFHPSPRWVGVERPA